MYKQLVMLLDTPPNKVDVGVQTNSLCLNSDLCDQHKINTTQDACITSNYEELFNVKETLYMDEKVLSCVEESNVSLMEDNASVKTLLLKEDDTGGVILDEQSQETTILMQTLSTGSSVQQQPPEFVRNNDENSQDSLLQHMEDMFCESEDSSDLMTLIEKHSGVSKASIDKEISKMCLENDDNKLTSELMKQTEEEEKEESNNIPKVNVKMPTNTVQGKFSFSYYKEMKNRADKPTGINENETIEYKRDTCENKQKKKSEGMWLVERVHQVSKLKTKMTELSLTNYRRHGKVKDKFIELFGESEEEDMMPDSPICIEEHLTACKERIAPWIVKYLMPFYKKRRIKDRLLFKAVAKHIADMLIIENTFPGEEIYHVSILNLIILSHF